jgi:hypothetical protein
MRTTNQFLVLLVLGAVSTMPLGAQHSGDELPEGVEQILERGRIAAVTEPEFVTATEADIPDGAWVLAAAINGVAKAYSLNLLNRHEVVNDRFGDLPVAAVW